MNPRRKENTSHLNHFRVDLQEREILNRRTTVIQVKAEESFRIETLKDSLRADLQEDQVAVHQEVVEERLAVGFRDLKDSNLKKDMIIVTQIGPHLMKPRKLKNLMSQCR
jgi:hypothetical protein